MMSTAVQASGDLTVIAGAWMTLQKYALPWSRRQFPQKGTVLAIFLIAVTKYPRGKGGRICFGLQFEGIQSIKVRKAWQPKQKATGRSHCLYSQETEGGKYWCSAHFTPPPLFHLGCSPLDGATCICDGSFPHLPLCNTPSDTPRGALSLLVRLTLEIHLRGTQSEAAPRPRARRGQA